MKKSLSRIFFGSLLLLLAAAMGFVTFWPTVLEKSVVPNEELFDADWQTPALTQSQKVELLETLNGPFYYLSEGGQSYVFESAKGDYVLKLFKFDRIQKPKYLNYLPNLPPFSRHKQQVIAKREKRRRKLLEGYKTAFELIREESGLSFVQLKPDGKENHVILVKKGGQKEVIDLGSTAFVVQKRGKQLSKVLGELLERGDVVHAKQRLDQVVSLYLLEYKRGVVDRDHGVMHNIGFFEEKPLHLDLGEVIYDPSVKESLVYREDLKKIKQKITSWVSRHYPQYKDQIFFHLNRSFDEETGENH